MTDREKVMRGAECCTKDVYDPYSCEECPYLGHKPTKKGCITVMLEDALALLKAQEPRMLTLDQVCGGDECWIEYRYGGNGYADVYLEEPGRTAKVYRCHPVGYKRPETVWLHDYGKLWRGWTFRPTKKQRKAVKWDE